jgi:hypothetical protein
MVRYHERILEQALEQLLYRVRHELRLLADRLGAAGSQPCDVLDLHRDALEHGAATSGPPRPALISKKAACWYSN